MEETITRINDEYKNKVLIGIAKERIKHELKLNHSHVHNAIGVTLAQLAKDVSYEEANKLVDYFNLTERFSIMKVVKK
jgi:hypothetical protein